MKKFYNVLLCILIISFTFSSCSSGEEAQAGGDQDQQGDTTSATIWTGSKITFSKADGADHTQAANQDRLTSNVWITRGDRYQIFNIVKESVANQGTSPVGTTWAIGDINDIDNLTFRSFRPAVGKPKNVVGKNLVMHLTEDNIYLSVKFTSWSQNKRGGFAYERSQP